MLFLFTVGLHAQQIVKTSTTHALSGSAAKQDALIDFSIQKDKNEVTLTYLVKDNKKKIVIETYTFDLGNLSSKGVQETEIEKEKAKSSYRNYNGGEYTRFVRVKNNVTGQMVLERGYLTTGAEFMSEQKVKFKEENNRKQSLVALRTEATQYNLQLVGWGELAKRRNYLGKGNALIFTMVKPKSFKGSEIAPGTQFKSMIISYDNLSILSENDIMFKYPYYPFSYTETSDGGFAILFIPMNHGTLISSFLSSAEVEIQPNLNEFVLLTIDSKGKETARYPFEVKHANANLKITETADGNFIINGYSNDFKVLPNDKKPNITPGYINNPNEEYGKCGIIMGEPTFYEIIKISKTGNVLFSNSVSLKKTLEDVVASTEKGLKLPNVDKWEKYFKNMPAESSVFNVNANIFIQFNSSDQNNYQLVQFNDKGEFITSYFVPKTGDILSDMMVASGPNSTAYWISFEHPKEKADETWMKITQLDPNNKKIIASEIPGDTKFYIQGSSAFTTIEGLGEAIFYLKSGKKIMLGKLTF